MRRITDIINQNSSQIVSEKIIINTELEKIRKNPHLIALEKQLNHIGFYIQILPR